MNSTRITGSDDMMSIVSKMSEGNPGAVNVLINLIEKTSEIDPQNFLGGLGPILTLDTLNVYGSRIWMLYKYVCKESVANIIGLIRSVQMGIISADVLNHAIDNFGDGLDVQKTLSDLEVVLSSINLRD
jgi:hypothetical protein